MKAGFFEVDITPRVGVGLCGFGPYLNRYSIGVRDLLKARAAAFELEGVRTIIVSCDLIAVTPEMVREVRLRASSQTGVPAEAIMIHCTHTHSGPNTGGYGGWGNEDEPYNLILPLKIAAACVGAVERLRTVDLSHAVAPCEGIGFNREHEKDAPPLEEVLRDSWRPARPELTDTMCQVLKFTAREDGAMLGFMAYFGCHPVVCCQTTRYIHGDYCGVAMNNLEREHPGSVGLFLQGAQGDVNTCVVHKPEQESLLALDIIAARFSNAVRAGLQAAKPLEVTTLAYDTRLASFSSKQFSPEQIRTLVAEQEAVVFASGASDADFNVRMAVVTLQGLRTLLARMDRGEDLHYQLGEIQGIRLGPIAFLVSPFEIMQAIKNDVVAAALAPIPLVMGVTNGNMGYAPDNDIAARGGYPVDVVPMIVGRLPYANIHAELREAFLMVDNGLFAQV